MIHHLGIAVNSQEDIYVAVMGMIESKNLPAMRNLLEHGDQPVLVMVSLEVFMELLLILIMIFMLQMWQITVYKSLTLMVILLQNGDHQELTRSIPISIGYIHRQKQWYALHK